MQTDTLRYRRGHRQRTIEAAEEAVTVMNPLTEPVTAIVIDP